MYVQRHPHVQNEMDPKKKTIVVLGSGWASTSFLKDIDTDDYNVVSYLPRKYMFYKFNVFSHVIGGCFSS